MKKILFTALIAVFVTSCFFAATSKIFAEGNDKYEPKLVLYEEYWKEMLERRWEFWYGKDKEYDPTDTTFFYNPYKVMVDVNWEKAYPAGTGCPTDPPFWGTYDFQLSFEKNIIPRKEIDPENKPVYYTIDDILPQYEKCIEGFKQLETRYGKFKFVDKNTILPDTVAAIPDKQVEIRRGLKIEFESYVPAYRSYFEPEYPVKLDTGMINILESINLVVNAWFDAGLDGRYFLTGIAEPEYYELQFYPSIATTELTIMLNEEDIFIPKEIKIFNNLGKIVKSLYTGLATKQNININSLPTGHYTVQIGKYIGRFIKR